MAARCIKFIGAFPDGDIEVELTTPSGGGGSSYHLMVGKFYWGQVVKYNIGWRVCLQIPNPDYCYGDLYPLVDIIEEWEKTNLP
ncbi:hypothetical protein ACJVDH_00480 [Pedobacter sp. AW1-32]|uniref:hypothetical protein n=1 Tax=Pedobacter sp. AW1-32 TaxID=3383026 RepID=UPI003FEE8780